MSFGEAVRTCFQKYATFSGRARPSEYWWWVLFYLFVIGGSYLLVFGLAGAGSNPDSINFLFGFIGLAYLVLLIPNLAVLVRRLHDTGRSGWYFFLSLIPCIGPLILLAFLTGGSDPDTNQYGPPPPGTQPRPMSLPPGRF